MPAARRKFGLAIVEGIEQKAGLELIGGFGIGEAIDETTDAHFVNGNAGCRHDGPLGGLYRLGSLAAVLRDSSAPRLRAFMPATNVLPMRLAPDAMRQASPGHGQAGSRLGLAHPGSGFQVDHGGRHFPGIRDCLLQALAAILVPVRCSPDTVNGESPCPPVFYSFCEYLDNPAFVIESLHGPDHLVWGIRLQPIYPACAGTTLEMRQKASPATCGPGLCKHPSQHPDAPVFAWLKEQAAPGSARLPACSISLFAFAAACVFARGL
jgi:hypothetical protein